MADTKLRARKKATAMLREDHQKVKKLFSRYEEDGEAKDGIFSEIRQELEIHTQIEEEIFYPAVHAAEEKEAARLVREAREEHRLVKNLLEELSALTPGQEDFEAKLKVLKDNVLHHIEEEQDEVFPVFDGLPKDARDEVAERLQMRKRELQSGE